MHCMLDRTVSAAMSLWMVAVASANPNSGLAMEVKAIADRVVIGEPILLDVALTNQGVEPVSVSRELAQWGNHAQYFVSTNGLNYNELPGRLSERMAPRITLAPGESVRHIEWLLVDIDAPQVDHSIIEFIAKIPGQYTFYTKYITQLDDGTSCNIESNRVSVTVVNASPEASALLSRMRHVFFFETNPDEYNGANFDAKTAEDFAALAEQASPYSSYAAFVLAKHELAKLRAPASQPELHDLRGAELVAPQREWAEQALAYLERADVESFPLRAEAVRAKIDAYRFKSRLTKRVAHADAQTRAQMREHYPDLWASEAEAEELQRRLLTEFPDSAAAWRLRKELEPASPRRP